MSFPKHWSKKIAMGTRILRLLFIIQGNTDVVKCDDILVLISFSVR